MSIMILVYVVLGGIGSIRGSVIATVILYLLPEMLRGLSNYRMLMYAIVLILAMLFNSAPQFEMCIRYRGMCLGFFIQVIYMARSRGLISASTEAAIREVPMP